MPSKQACAGARERQFAWTPARAWVAGAALLSITGWGLSLLGALNTVGYAIVVAVMAAAALSFSGSARLNTRKLRRRLKCPLPFCFLLMALLIFIGGLLHAPNNDDALSYRIPRVLNWLAEGRWHWIHTPHPAMNSHVVGTEWLLAPWLALMGTDRWVFLINFAAYLVLPGLVFSVFCGLGVRSRVAWHWMWLLPSGYNYILQAGGDANDILGVVYALAAMHFALRAHRTKQAADAWFAIVAAALLTGCKLSNLPLLLPIALALLPSVRLLLARPLASGVVMLAGLAASVVPMAAINLHYCGDWTGTANENKGAGEAPVTAATTHPTGTIGAQAATGTVAPPMYVFVVKDPLVGISGNCLSLACDNLLPPVFPMAGWWNAHNREFLPAGYRAKLAENFEPDFLRLRELPGEERAGLGFGVCWLVVIGCVAAWLGGGRDRVPARGRDGSSRSTGGQFPSTRSNSVLDAITRWSPYFSLAVFMAKSGITAGARIVAPYYALLLPALLRSPAHERVVRSRWWHRAELVAYSLAFVVLIIAPDRPLWPAQTVLKQLQEQVPNPLFRRAALVYEVYADRPDAFAPLREWIPTEVHMLGMLCLGNEPSTSLWRPFRHRRVRQLFFSDSRAALDEWGIRYIVARDTGADFAAWLMRVDGEVLGRKTLQLYASREPIVWAVVKLREPQINHQL